MLYNPQWQKADPYSVVSLAAWLEKQPPDKEYNPMYWKECLLGQYFIAMTGDATPSALAAEAKPANPLWTLYQIAVPKYWGERGQSTFGAALNRARRELA